MIGIATYPNSSGSKPGVGAPVIAVAVVLLLALIGWLAWSNFSSKTQPLEVKQTNKSPAELKLEELAKKSQGDWNKLTPADQQEADKVTMGHGQIAVQSAWDSMHK